MTPYGIHETLWNNILTTCFNFKSVDHVILFGSRARYDFHEGSDIDIAIDAPRMSAHEFSQLWNTLDDLPLIFKLDVIHLQALSNPSLLDAIKKEGVFFTRT
ncbi:MAG: nucleotidyltransferase family protein [Legionellaceae bacterium]